MTTRVKPRIAVVEDDAAIGDMITQFLAFEGFDVHVFSDGAWASSRVRNLGAAAVVLDVMLPGKDGLTILRELRASPATADLPIVMLSAKTDSATTWQGWSGGANYVMSKPFEPEELARVLRYIIGS
jgi:two-component system, OmpR family, phosphate regulon response regulator PhoB